MMDVIEITTRVRIDYDMTMTKNRRSFLACVELEAATRAIHCSRIIVESQL